MLDLGVAGDFIVLDASAGSALTAIMYGLHKTTTDRSGIRKKLASMELTGGADTLYTLSEREFVENAEIVVVNRTASIVTLEVWHVASGGSADNSNRIVPTGFPVPANGRITISQYGIVTNTGTVTSVAATVPAELSVSGSPITTSGTLAFSWANQSANLIFAGPSSGGAAAPAFRAAVIADLGFVKRGSGTLNFGAIAPNSSADLTLTVTGAQDGDEVLGLGIAAAVISGGTNCGNISFSAWVSGADTVTVRCTNHDLALTADPASGTFKASVLRA